jgi:hypothetical protein
MLMNVKKTKIKNVRSQKARKPGGRDASRLTSQKARSQEVRKLKNRIE